MSELERGVKISNEVTEVLAVTEKLQGSEELDSTTALDVFDEKGRRIFKLPDQRR